MVLTVWSCRGCTVVPSLPGGSGDIFPAVTIALLLHCRIGLRLAATIMLTATGMTTAAAWPFPLDDYADGQTGKGKQEQGQGDKK